MLARHPHVAVAAMILAAAVLLLALFAWSMSRSDSGGSISGVEGQLREYLHSPMGEVTCESYASGSVLKTPAGTELPLERSRIIMDEECLGDTSGAKDVKTRFREWLHTDWGALTCAIYVMNGGLLDDPNSAFEHQIVGSDPDSAFAEEISLEQRSAIMEEECR